MKRFLSTFGICLALVAAQLPFWIKASVRFCRLWAASSWSRCSILEKMPLL